MLLFMLLFRLCILSCMLSFMLSSSMLQREELAPIDDSSLITEGTFIMFNDFSRLGDPFIYPIRFGTLSEPLDLGLYI